MGNYYALELFARDKRQIFFSEKGMPPSEFLTVFRPCDRAYPEFTSGIEDSDEPGCVGIRLLVFTDNGETSDLTDLVLLLPARSARPSC